MSKEKKAYSQEYKLQAVKLAKELGFSRAKKELGVPQSTFSKWIAQEKNGELDLGAGNRSPETALSLVDELKACREKIKQQDKKIAELEKLNTFLDEASRFFASSQQK